jgi:hypothetical protein
VQAINVVSGEGQESRRFNSPFFNNVFMEGIYRTFGTRPSFISRSKLIMKNELIS